MRLIDADALIISDEECVNTICRDCKMQINGCADFFDIIENATTIEPEQQWIPCSERLPEEKDAGILKKLGTNKRSDYVIATVEAKGERITVTACTYDGAWDWNMKYAFPDYKIIAWMPLPDPYKERWEK